MPFLPEQSPHSRLRGHAKRHGLGDPGLPPAERLTRAKTFLVLEKKLQQRLHRRGESGLAVAQERSAMVDVLLESLWESAVAGLGGVGPGEACIVAQGGYGRGELCPHSDLDILLLYSPRVPAERLGKLKSALTEGILYPLWDMGFKVGHASRDIAETLAESRANILSKIALLETRLVAGDPGLYADLRLALSAEVRTPGFARDTVRHLLDEQERRREKNGDSVFVQEPEVKNGVGGLRDLHTLVWLARIRNNVGALREFATRGWLPATDVAKLEDCRSFLLRVRHELHYLSPRANDTLTLEKQPVVAENLGYAGTDWVERVERFMRDYYAAADFVIRTVREAEWRLERSSAGKSFSLASPQRRHSGETVRTEAFDIADGRIDAQRPTVFDEDPVRLIRVFRHAQRHGAQLSGDLVRLIREKAPLFTFRHANDPEAHKAFLAILGDAGRVYPALNAMRDLGVLIRYLPEFAPMICLVQHELYHRYTADIHTLLCIKELDAVFAGETPGTDAYREALFGTEDPPLLYLILLLHDIGKPLGIKGHAETGVAVAAPFLNRLGISDDRRALINGIIRGHLDMGAFWQKHDIEDPDIVARFADKVGSPEALRLLFAHTFCDARATTQGLWNGYKDQLHTRLYHHALARLEGRSETEADAAPLRASLLAACDKAGYAAGTSREETGAHLSLLPLRYLRRIDAATVMRHAKLIGRLILTITEADGAESLMPAVDWEDDLAAGMGEVSLASWDRPGLFYRVCGAFAMTGLSIHATRAYAREDGIALDVFHVTEADGTPPRPARRETFLKHLHTILVEDKDPRPTLEARAKGMGKPREAMRRPRDPRVLVEYDAELGRTVVEIRAADRIGLLFDLGRILFEHRRDIAFARIATESGYARDTFYITPFTQEPEPSPDQNESLRAELLKTVSA